MRQYSFGRETREPKLPPTPRYEGPAVIDVAALISNPSEPVIRQRNRLTDVLSQLSSKEWSSPSRCEGWSVQDVAEHLVSVNQFFLLSISSALRGEPTRILASFNPVRDPAAIVQSARGAAPGSTLEKLAASNSEFAALLWSLRESDWEKLAEAPPGHIAVSGVCAHALWDAWIHERDVLLPLGRDPQAEPDEVTIALAYVAAIGPAIYLNAGQARSGSLVVRASHPDLVFTVAVGDQVKVHSGVQTPCTALVEGDAVDLVEGFSCRGPYPQVTADHRWLVDGLHRVFGVSG